MDKVVFLDRDGTLNPDPGYIASVEEYEFYDETLDVLYHLSKEGYSFIIVTNQSGVGRGIITQDALERINEFITDSFESRGIPLLGIYFCPHTPDEGCACRKPKTGLFEMAAHDHSVNLDSSYMVGDSIRDIEAGNAVGMTTLLVRTGIGKESETKLKENGIPVKLVGNSLRDCAEYILAEGKEE